MPRIDLILLQDMQSYSRMKTKPKKGESAEFWKKQVCCAVPILLYS